MAITQNPIIGRARNQAGGMIFSKSNDKNVMRAKPQSVRNSKSQGQKAQRSFIAELTKYTKQFTPDNLLELFPRSIASRSRYSELQRQLAVGRDVNGEFGSIYFDNVRKLGNGPSILSGSSDSSIEAGVLTVDWSAMEANEPNSAYGNVVIIAFNKNTNKAIFFDTGKKWSEGTADLPNTFVVTNGDDYFVFVSKYTVKFKPGGELAESVQ